jgi:laccase
MMPKLTYLNDTTFTANFSGKLRSLANSQFLALVPRKVDMNVFLKISLGLNPCPKGMGNTSCKGPNKNNSIAYVNNIYFFLPSTALLESHYFKQMKGIYKINFPDNPPFPFNYTGTPPNNTAAMNETRVKVLPFNTTVQLVLQDTNIFSTDSHPLHLHGFNFFVVGQGVGNYNESTDAPNFNLIDPVERNTIGVPKGGWAALRFHANNPGTTYINAISSHITFNIQLH